MKRNNDINDDRFDGLFRGRLEHYTPEPPSLVWERVEATLSEKKKPAGLFPYRWAAAAAVLLIAMISGLLFNDQARDTSLPTASETAVTAPPSGETPAAFPATPPAPGTSITDQQPLTAEASPGRVPPTPSSVREATAPARLPASASQATGTTHSPLSLVASGDNRSAGRDVPGFPSGEITPSSPQENDAPAVRFSFRELASISGRVISTLYAGTPSLRFRDKHKAPTIQPGVSPEWIAMTTAGSPGASHRDLSNGSGEWSVGMLLTPAYASYSADHTPEYARNMTSSASHAQATVGAGIAVSYKASPRWRVESGIYYSRSGDESENAGPLFASGDYYDNVNLSGDAMKYFNTAVTLDNGQMAMNSTAGVIAFSKTPRNTEFIALPESYAGVTTSMLTPGKFYQVFDFMEIPLTARYRLIDAAIPVELIGGVSTNMVLGNNVYTGDGAGRENVGQTADISTVNLAGIMGVGIGIPLGKNLTLSLEPRASYFLQSMNHSGAVDFRPWKTALYTGISWDF